MTKYSVSDKINIYKEEKLTGAQKGTLVHLCLQKLDEKIICTPLYGSKSFEVNDNAFVNMNMVLIYDICEKRSEVFKFKANNNIKIITIKICTNNGACSLCAFFLL